MQHSKTKPVSFILIFYVICFAVRIFEYFFIRTDQTVFGEAFINKLIGILLLAAAVRLLQYKWADIGFVAKRAFRGTMIGLLIGLGMFTIAYGAEMFIQATSDNAPQLQFYVTSYAIQGNRVMESGLFFILICIAGNIINVIMEEGVFRGLFNRLMEEKYSFLKACIFSSILFGIWHIAQPIRNVLDGSQSVMGGVMSGIVLVVTSTLFGILLNMLLKITGSLWAGMAVHFVNNAIINLLHVTTATGSDELQAVRITVAQTISFIAVLVVFIRHRKREGRKIESS